MKHELYKLLVGLLLLLLTLTPGISRSVGLGNLDVQTHLAQPLRANIELVAVNPDELDQIKVRLANREDFEWVGIERTSELEQLRFAPFISKSGIPTIAVTTALPLQKDSLNFLIEVRWPEGRLLREYTIKLEPIVPGYEPTPIETYPPMVGGGAAQHKPQIPQTPEATSTESTDVDSGASPSQRLDRPVTPPLANPYTTVRGDTLYEIARDYMPGGDVNPRQMALALFRANPDAFNNQDINHLKTNVPLRIPEINEIKELSRRPLKIEQQDQTQKSSEKQTQPEKKGVPEVREPKPEVIADKPGAVADKPPVELEPVDTQGADNQQETQSSENAARSPQPMEEAEPYLEIVTEETQLVEPDPKTVEADDYIANMENTVALTHELAESREQENTELKTRIQELKSMISRQERLITLQSTQMAEIHKAAIANANQSTPIIWQWVLIVLIGLTIMLMVLVLRLYRRDL